MTNAPTGLLAATVALAEEAAHAILASLASGLVVTRKADGSPVTNADHAAHAILAHGLARLTPSIPIISEENDSHPTVTNDFWCVDPLDGTRSIIDGTGEYVVSIGLIRKGLPHLGVLYCPRDHVCYAGEVGQGAFKRALGNWTRINAALQHEGQQRAILGARDAKSVGVRMQDYLKQLNAEATLFMSSARKFGVLAEGTVDIYPRFMRTYEWDIAAGHAILRSIGGELTTLDGSPMAYAKPNFENGGFVARRIRK